MFFIISVTIYRLNGRSHLKSALQICFKNSKESPSLEKGKNKSDSEREIDIDVIIFFRIFNSNSHSDPLVRGLMRKKKREKEFL